jgi:hypothetical protein
LICSFPLLQDPQLSVATTGIVGAGYDTPLSSSKLSGSLCLTEEVRAVARGLLGLPGDLHLKKITISCYVRDSDLVADLVVECSATLESLRIFYQPSGAYPLASTVGHHLNALHRLQLPSAPDLAGVMKLKNPNIEWITRMLETAKSTKHCKITIGYYSPSTDLAGEKIRQELQHLDRLLDQMWTSHAVLPEIIFEASDAGDGLRSLYEVCYRSS